MCTCGSEGKRHRRSCPLSYRNRRPGRTLFPATSNAGQLASPSALNVECSPGDSVFPPSSKKEKTEDESRGSRLYSLEKYMYGQFSSPLSHCRGVQWSVSTLLFTGCSDHLVLCH